MKGKGIGETRCCKESRMQGTRERAEDKIGRREDAGTSRVTEGEHMFERLVIVDGRLSRQRGYCCPWALV